MRRIIASTALAAMLLVGGANAASATDVTPQGLCPGGREVYKASNSAVAFTQASGGNSSVTGGPGVTLSISTSTTFTVSGSIGTNVDITASAAILAIKQGYSVTVQASRSGTTTNSGSWTVPASYNVGRLQIGAMKYAGTVTKYLENTSCVLVKKGSTVTYNAPKNEWHFESSRVS